MPEDWSLKSQPGQYGLHPNSPQELQLMDQVCGGTLHSGRFWSLCHPLELVLSRVFLKSGTLSRVSFFQFYDLAEVAISSIRWFSQMATCSIWKFLKTIIYLHSWLPAGTSHANLAIWDFFSFEILSICVNFFLEKSLCIIGQNQVKFRNFFFPIRKTTDPFSIYVPVSKGSRVFFSILWCSQTGDHPQEDSAKFGYRPGMKVKRSKNPSHFWLQARTQ